MLLVTRNLFLASLRCQTLLLLYAKRGDARILRFLRLFGRLALRLRFEVGALPRLGGTRKLQFVLLPAAVLLL